MDVVGVVFIATNHFLIIALFLPPWTVCALVRMVHPCTSTAEIATVSSNDYINGYKCIKSVVRCQPEQSQTVRPCTPDDPRGC
jgi:hypothetical protein